MKKKKLVIATAIGLSVASAPSWAFLNLNWWSLFYKPPVTTTTTVTTQPSTYTGTTTTTPTVVNPYQSMSESQLLAEARKTFGTLNDKTVPLPDLSDIVKDKEAAIQLGKAFFWDVAAGSDGQACASCHFQAGADPRITNQLSPGTLDLRDLDHNGVNGDQKFGGTVLSSPFRTEYSSPQGTEGLTASGNQAGPNITLAKQDFPMHKLQDRSDRNSKILYTTNDVVSSMGTIDGPFIAVGGKNSVDDKCGQPVGHVFHKNGLPSRRVEPRNTPTMINAVFTFRNFWDGRANNIFNGVDVFGKRSHSNPRAKILQRDGKGNMLTKRIALKDASLASQAMGPPISADEMSCSGRTLADVGRKLLARKALSTQKVSQHDSVLGGLASDDQGLIYTYRKMIRAAFKNKYTLKGLSKTAKNRKYVINNSGKLVVAANGYTMEELNFSLYWGIAVMLYEATLINDDNQSAFGRLMKGDNNALTSSEKNGLRLFLGKGNCASCHEGPTLTSAAFIDKSELIEKMSMASLNLSISSFSQTAFYDNGFYNIGVTPTVEDIGLGGKDPFNNPLSFTRQLSSKNSLVDPVSLNSSGFLAGSTRVAVDGSFKTPSLLNVALTPPFFHNGSASSLFEVVAFYNRGGNRRDIKNVNGKLIGDTTGTGVNGRPDGLADAVNAYPPGSNLDPDIESLGFSGSEMLDLVRFMRTLTDERVRCEKAPFDHPELRVPFRHVDEEVNYRAKTIFATLPAVGAAGVPSTQCINNTGYLFNVQGRLKEDSIY